MIFLFAITAPIFIGINSSRNPYLYWNTQTWIPVSTRMIESEPNESGGIKIL